MSNNVINPQVAFTDSAGNPRAGGFLHFYTNRTPSYAVVYSDEALTIPQSNPYTLDAYGRVDGDIKFTETLTMKATNADGSDQKTYNDVTSGGGDSSVSEQYKVTESDPQAMTVTLKAGRTMSDNTLVSNAAQTTTVITAPAANPRIDRIVVNKETGVFAIIAGAESATPSAPAITSGNAPAAQILIQTSSTVITDAMITDERLSESFANKTLGAVTLNGGYITDRVDSTTLGYEAHNSLTLTAARESVAVGYRALYTTASAQGCTAVGSEALYFCTTGDFSTGVGYRALYSLTNGSRNTAVGFNALYANTEGLNNTAIGEECGQRITTGDGNTAIGQAALEYCVTSGNNTAVGGNSLRNATGANNTGLGYTAGDLTTTGANNTSLGYQADPTANSASNEVTLGNSSVSVIRAQVTTITSLSDERDKANIENLNLGLSFIDKLRPVSFDWNMRDEGKIGDPDTGFIAQELKAAQSDGDTLPGLVYESNPEKLEAGYGKLIPVMVKAIQELSEKVATLEKKLAQ